MYKLTNIVFVAADSRVLIPGAGSLPKKTWSDAKKDCEEKGMQLAVLDTFLKQAEAASIMFQNLIA